MKSVVLCGHNKCATRWLAEVIKSAPGFNYVIWRDVTPEREVSLRQQIDRSGKVTFIDYPFAIQNEEALSLLKRIDADMAGLIIYREPIEAMLSMHNYSRKHYGKAQFGGPKSNISFEEFISDKAFVDSVLNAGLRSVYEGIYRYDLNSKNLRVYFTTYKELLYDDLKKDTEEFLSSIFSFCGVDLIYEMPQRRVNRSLAFKSYWFHKKILAIFFRLTGIDSKVLVHAYADGSMKLSLVYLLMWLNDKRSHFLKPEQIQRLRYFFAPMVQDFARITELDLTPWGYSDHE